MNGNSNDAVKPLNKPLILPNQGVARLEVFAAPLEIQLIGCLVAYGKDRPALRRHLTSIISLPSGQRSP